MAIEHRHGEIEQSGDVDIATVPAHRVAEGAAQAIDPVDTIGLGLDVRQFAVVPALEDHDRVVGKARRVDVAAVGADADPHRGVEAGYRPDTVELSLQKVEATVAVALEDGDRGLESAGAWRSPRASRNPCPSWLWQPPASSGSSSAR